MGNIPTEALDHAIRHALRPLVRLLLARGVRYPAICVMLKDLYFEEALAELGEDPGTTTSRISLSTGLHRKDVSRMRAEGEAREPVALETALASEVFTRWISERRFLDARRKPRPLPRLASVGGERSFEALATSVSSDVRAKALLDELLRLGLVRLDGDDQVVLNGEAFVPRKGSGEVLYYFGENLHDHLAAAVHNLLGREPALLEQAIFGGDLSRESVDELAELVRRAWHDLVQEIVPRASKLDERDAKAGRTDHRMRFGIYFYSEAKQAKAKQAKAKQAKEKQAKEKRAKEKTAGRKAPAAKPRVKATKARTRSPKGAGGKRKP